MRLELLLSLVMGDCKVTACLGLPFFKCWCDREGPLEGGPIVFNLGRGWGDNCMGFHLSLAMGTEEVFLYKPFLSILGGTQEESLSGSPLVNIVGIAEWVSGLGLPIV